MRALAFAAALLLPGFAGAQLEVRETDAWAARAPVAPVLVETVGQVTATPGFIQVPVDGDDHRLEVLWVAPAEAAPGDARPAIVISHGNPRRGTHRRLRLHRYGWLAEEFARRGYVALVLARRGFGKSSGAYDEWYGACEEADADGYVRGGRAGAQDLAAALDHLARDPRVDPGRLLAMGQSGGGFASLALAADPPPGLAAVINLAGGRGSFRDGENCNAEGLTGAFARFGTPRAVPSLWLYARTDRFFWPDLVEAHFAAFQGPARLVMFDDILHAEDGHRLFQRGNTALWRPAMDAFLRDVGLPTWDRPPPLPDDLDLPAPDGLGAEARAQWRAFTGSEMHRAFATGPGGAWGWASAYATPDEAAARALAACAEQGDGCQLRLLDAGPP